MPDITQLLQFAVSTPAEAAENIDDANAFAISPDVYKENKENLQPELKTRQLPKQASDTVSKYVEKSSEHAALAGPDVEKLSWMDKRIKYLGDQVNKIPTLERQANDLAFKKMFKKDEFSPTDELQLEQYKGDLKDQTDYGIGDITDPNTPLVDKAIKGLGFLGQVGRGFFDSINENKGKIATATIGTAAVTGGAALVTGPGAIPAAVAGAGVGLSYSVLGAMALDGATQQAGSTYNMLSDLTDDQGNPLKIDDTTKRNISIGVGTAVGALSFVGGRTVAKTVPFLEAMLTKKGVAEILAAPAKQGLKQALAEFGKASAAGMIEGSSQEFVKTIGEEMGKTFDGSEASFISGLNNAVAKLPQNAGRIAEAGVGNAAAAGAFHATAGGASSVGKKVFDLTRNAVSKPIVLNPEFHTTDIIPMKPKGGGDAPETPVDHAVDVLHLDSAIKDIQKVSNTTEMKKIAPGQLFQLRKSMMQEAGVDTIYIDKEELTHFADSPEKAADVKNMIDNEGAPNAPVQVEGHKFLDLVEKYPDSAELAKLTPEGPNAAQAKKYLEDMAAAGEKRKAIMEKLGAKDITPEDTATLQQALDTEQPFRMYPSNEVFGEHEYLNQPNLHEAIQKMYPSKDGEMSAVGEKFAAAQLKARESVAQNIHETAVHEMDQIVDITTREGMDAEYQSQLERLSKDPNLAIVDKFAQGIMKPDNRYETPSRATEAHAREGFSPLAIDPRLMTDEQKAQFLRDPQLRKHKAFVKGGISPEDSARLLGVNNGDNLLKILSSTPTREQAAEIRTQARAADVAAKARDSVDLNKTAIIQAYNDNTANHIAELKHMREQEWSDLKGGIKKIALPLPTKEGLRAQAESAIGSTKVGKLNRNQFAVGERKSQRLAVDSILNNQVEKAFVNKQAAALNSELARATMIATGKVNRVLKLARRFDTPEITQLLKSTGFDKAANEILDVYNLSTKRKGTSEKDSFQKYLDKSLSEGEAVVEIPKRLQDVRQSLNDTSVDTVVAVGDVLQNLLHQAKMKNRLYEKHDQIRVLKTIEGLGNALEKQAKLNPEYDPGKNKIVQEVFKTTGDRIGDVLDSGTYLRRSQNLLVTMDNGKDVGLANDLFWQTIREGNNKQVKMGIDVANQMDTIIEKFGKKDFEDLRSQKVNVPEFKGIPELNNGKMTKAELLKMNLNRGNGGNHEALERFGVSRDVIKTVLERELGDHRYMELTQRIWDIHKSFEPHIEKLQKDTQGTDVKFVQAEPLEFTDKNGDTRTYPGGYYPLQYVIDPVKNISEKLIGTSESNKADKFRQKFYAQAQTEQGHLEARTGNTAVLDLNLNGLGKGMAQTIHDLNMRIPIRDTAKLLSDKKIRETMVSVLGKDGHRAISNMVISEVNNVETKISSDAGGWLVNTGNFFMKNFAAAHILIKAGSILVQAGSLPVVIDRIPNGGKHFAATLAKMAGNFKEMTAFAEKYHAPLRDAREGFEGDVTHRLNEVLPKDRWIKGTDWVRAGHEIMTETGFSALQHVDNLNKAIAFHTAYRAAMNGDVPEINIGDHETAAKYASNVTELTTTHASNRNLAEIQREKWVKPFLMFYNDANIVLNHITDKAKQAKAEGKKAYGEFQQGNSKQGFGHTRAAVGTVMSTMLSMTVLQMWEKAAKGNSVIPFNDDDDAETAVKKSMAYLVTAPAEQLIGGTPFLKDADYTLDFQALTHRKQKLEPPPMKIGNTFIDTYTGLKAALDFSDEARDVTPAEKKSFLYSAGYAFGIPSDSIYKYILKPDWSDMPANAKGELQQLSDRIGKFVKMARGESDKANASGLSDAQIAELEAAQSLPEEAIRQLEQYREEIDPGSSAPTGDRVPQSTYDIIKKIESNGDWSAQNPESSATGLYQFTEGTWKDLMDKHPELGLTEDGRVSADTEQQETAMRFFTEKNVDKLERNGLEATVENIYAAHFLGAGGAVNVLSSSDSDKLKDIVGAGVMKANSFRKNMTVKNFKKWLERKTSNAATALQDDKEASVDTATN